MASPARYPRGKLRVDGFCRKLPPQLRARRDSARLPHGILPASGCFRITTSPETPVGLVNQPQPSGPPGHRVSARSHWCPTSRPEAAGGTMRKNTNGRSVRGLSGDPRRRYQARHRAMGLCTVCPRPLANGSAIFCEWHRLKNRLRKRRLRGPVLCRRCRKPLAGAGQLRGRRYHRLCLRVLRAERGKSRHYRELHASAARAYQQRHEAQGLCTQCPRPAVPGKHVCEEHLRYRQDRYRRLKSVNRGQQESGTGETRSGHSSRRRGRNGHS